MPLITQPSEAPADGSLNCKISHCLCVVFVIGKYTRFWGKIYAWDGFFVDFVPGERNFHGKFYAKGI
jgi:hypothetical protein